MKSFTAFRRPRYLIPLLSLTALLAYFVLPSTSSTTEAKMLRHAAELLSTNRHQEALQALTDAPASGSKSLMAGVAALRLKRYEEAVLHLSEAERSHPQLADVAMSLKAEAQLNLKQYQEAHLTASAAAKATPLPSRSRRMEKLAADALFEAGDLPGALAAYRRFNLHHTLGSDHVDALHKSALCLMQGGDRNESVKTLRVIWLKHPSSPQSESAFKQLRELAQQGVPGAADFSHEEQLERGRLLLANGLPAAASWVFADIPRTDVSEEFTARLDLAAGQAAVRQRHHALAEPLLKRAAGSRGTPDVRDEARLALARVEDRLDRSDLALSRLLTLASEKGPLADDALLHAALTHKSGGRFAEAALLLDRLVREFPQADQTKRAAWELAWCHYLAGDLPTAQDRFKRLLNDETYRERSLYWIARIMERQGRAHEADKNYATLRTEFPFGFYTAWHNIRLDKATHLAPAHTALKEPALPPGSQRTVALIELGILSEARAELAPLRTPGAVPVDSIPGLARLQQMAGDFHGSIITFHQNRPNSWDHANWSFWRLGFPRHYPELISRHTDAFNLSESLVLALTKAESSFRAEVKSHAGAIGLMQLMPATARQTAGYKDAKQFNPHRLIEPDYNMQLGTKHLRELLDQYQQDTVYTLAAYNAGAGAVKRWRKGFGQLERDEFIENIPFQETRDYVKKIIASIGIYKALYKIQ